MALRELRTYRRISGKDDQIALLVDSERGVGRPDRALEAGRAVDRAALAPGVRVELAIAMSGARLDLGEPERALISSYSVSSHRTARSSGRRVSLPRVRQF